MKFFALFTIAVSTLIAPVAASLESMAALYPPCGVSVFTSLDHPVANDSA